MFPSDRTIREGDYREDERLLLRESDWELYGGCRPIKEQSDAMTELTIAVDKSAVSQIRESGVCLSDSIDTA